MTVAVLTGACLILGLAAVREVLGGREAELAAWLRRVATRALAHRLAGLPGAALALGVSERIRAAGLEDRLAPALVLAAKGACGIAGGALAVVVAPAAPGRLWLVAVAGLPAAGFVAPDALLERTARRRREEALGSLPDALDVLAMGAAGGGSALSALGAIASAQRGALALELARMRAELECGVSQAAALGGLRRRLPAPELGALAGELERSRRLGSPLSERLHEQSHSLRQGARLRVEERAARAAPKIQLVVALVLVPSVLLMVLAALLAHSGALLSSS